MQRFNRNYNQISKIPQLCSIMIHPKNKDKQLTIQFHYLHQQQHNKNKQNNEYLQMHNESTQRSLSNSKYLTPRKTTAKKNNKISIFLQQNREGNKENVQEQCVMGGSGEGSRGKREVCEKEWKIQDFQIVKQMGRGKFGNVYAAKEKSTDYLVAIKKMSKKQLKQNDFECQVKRQITIQSSLHHPNILKLYSYFWDSDHIYLILEYAPQGQIFHLLQKSKKLPQSQISIIIRQVCEGLQYLHSNNIIHRDIKPENILLSNENIKIGDFGWSIHTLKRRETLCGTLDYLAPEIIKGEMHDHSIDIWQVGVLTYELAVGRPPFESISNQDTYQRILNEDVQFPNFVSYQLRKFIRKVLQKNPAKRMSCSDILKETFISKYSDLKLNLQK